MLLLGVLVVSSLDWIRAVFSDSGDHTLIELGDAGFGVLGYDYKVYYAGYKVWLADAPGVNLYDKESVAAWLQQLHAAGRGVFDTPGTVLEDTGP